MPRSGPRLLRGTVLALLGVGIPWFIADRALGWLGADWGLAEKTLYYNEVDLPLFRVGEDPFLHYELIPGATHQQGGPMGHYAVTVDRWGARGSGHPWDKPAGSFRVLVCGASSFFGGGVSDHQAMPARLESRLEAELGLDVEVWNFATSGYSASQVARKARGELARVPDPDLMIVSYTGHVRRPFLPPWPVGGQDGRGPAVEAVGPVDNRALFEQDPDLWVENFPRAPLGWLLGESLQGLLLRSLPSYRYLAALLEDWESPHPPTHQLRRLGELEMRALENEAHAAGLPLVYLNSPQMFGEPFPDAQAPFIDLAYPGQPPGYDAIHPAPEHLEAWAERTALGLGELGLLPPPVPAAADQNNE
jgi:hypothetical protein